MHRHAPISTPETLEEQMRQHVLRAGKIEVVKRRFNNLPIENPDFPLLAMEALIRKEPEHFSQVIEDWSRVTTTTQEVSTGDMMDEIPNLKGFFRLDNGVSVIGMELGEVEHHPVFAVIYHDGYEFRGYIPRRGNVYNRDTNSAFGLNPVADGEPYVRDHGADKGVFDPSEATRKLIGTYFHPLGFDSDAILDDLNSNIQAISRMAA